MIRYCFLIVLALVGCASEEFHPKDDFHGNWLLVNEADSAGMGVTFREDGSYTLVLLQLTSSVSGNATVENGRYVEDGSTLHLTVQETSCLGIDDEATMGTDIGFKLDGNSLVVRVKGAVFRLARNNNESADQFAYQLGCFKDGNFIPNDLKSVN